MWLFCDEEGGLVERGEVGEVDAQNHASLMSIC
jgi:hypothetical protein